MPGNDTFFILASTFFRPDNYTENSAYPLKIMNALFLVIVKRPYILMPS